MADFTWVLNDAGGKDLRSTEGFDTKEDAEAWMGEHWAELAAEGAESVTLISDGHTLYRMGLGAE